MSKGEKCRSLGTPSDAMFVGCTCEGCSRPPAAIRNDPVTAWSTEALRQMKNSDQPGERERQREARCCMCVGVCVSYEVKPHVTSLDAVPTDSKQCRTPPTESPSQDHVA